MKYKRELLTLGKGVRSLGLALALILGLGLTIGLKTALANSQTPSGTHVQAFFANNNNDNSTPSASFSVNTTQDNPDSAPGDGSCSDSMGNCSLRAAIEEGNALSGKDTIYLPANTYFVESQLIISDSLAIYGDNALATIIDAQGNSRVFFVDQSGESNPIDVSLLSLTIKNGNAMDNGGGISTNATLVIRDSIITQNTATNQGGGIRIVTGTLTIINSAIVSNTVEQDGSGIYALNSVVTITNSTISGNVASAGRGGGLYSETSQISLVNSTLANNTASYSTGAAGGGIYIQASVVKATNTIIAGNTDQSPMEQHPDCSGILTSSGNNLLQNIDGCALNGILTGVLTNTTPMLGLLTDHGGSTLTHAPLKNSPIINHGKSTDCPTTDQRGFNRRSGYCDIGAFEAQPENLSAVSGFGQRAALNTAFVSHLQTSAQDKYGNTLAGVTLTFAGPTTGPGISNGGEKRTTGVSGLASFIPVANGIQGSYLVTATTNALMAEYSLTNVLSSTTRIVSDLPDPSPINQPFTVSFTVTSTIGTPGGIVTVTVADRDEMCNSELTDGKGACELTISSMPGQYTLIATYSGNEQYMGSNASEVHTANAKVFLPIATRNYMPPSIFGVEFQSITPAGGLTQISAAKATWTRKNGVQWSSVSPNNATERQWANLATLEDELRNASSNNLETILIVRSTPTWAQQNPGIYCGSIKADALNEFANFLTDLVARYSVAPYDVKYWELWNEPDIDPILVPKNSVYGCWGNSNDPYYGGGYYAEMLKVAYPAIKAADPNAKVLIGGLLLDCDPNNPPAGKTCVESKFLEGILHFGGGPYFDGVSFHAYDYYNGTLGQYSNPNWHSSWNARGATTLAKTDYILGLLSQYNVSNKFLMNTETAILCDNCQGNSDYEQTKAYYIAQSYAIASSKELMANIWFSAMGWRTSGLLDQNLNPLPAYHAYAFARREIGNATFISPVLSYHVDNDTDADIIIYTFEQGNKQIWLIWSLDGGTYALSLPSTPSAAYDVFGNPLTITGNIFNASIAPVYLEWTK